MNDEFKASIAKALLITIVIVLFIRAVQKESVNEDATTQQQNATYETQADISGDISTDVQ